MKLETLKLIDRIITTLYICVGCVGIVLILNYLLGFLVLFLSYIDETLYLICALFLDGVLLYALIILGCDIESKIALKEYDNKR